MCCKHTMSFTALRNFFINNNFLSAYFVFVGLLHAVVSP